MTAGLHVHVPTPGDHFSPATGSAVMVVIYELARRHAMAGGKTQVIVGRGTRHDYTIAPAVEVDFPPLLSRGRKLVDAAVGRLALPRPFGTALYAPALRALTPSFDGLLMVHNDPNAVAMLARRLPGARVCLYLHNTVFRAYSRREIRRVMAAAHRVICVSGYVARDLERRAGSLPESVVVVHNGVDTGRFRPAPRDGAPGEPPVILFLGRVVPEKGVDLLFRAARRLADTGRSFRVRIVGSRGFSPAEPLSRYERELRRLAEPIRDRVEFRPFVDRDAVPAQYRSATIFCAPSNWDDPCPLTVLEGLASGLPGVASRRGGISEIGDDALLYFDPPDDAALAERLEGLLDDGAARADLGARARARAQVLSWENQYRALATALADGARATEGG